MKRLVIALVAVAGIAGLTGISTASAAQDGPSVCITGHVDLNGTVQDVDQCLPA